MSSMPPPPPRSTLFPYTTLFRSGVEELYLLTPDDPEQPELTKAHKFKVKQLTNTKENEAAASFSPKGDRIAYLRSGKLWTMKPDGTEQKVLIAAVNVFDYDWSPDGQHQREEHLRTDDRQPAPPADSVVEAE